jgi:hypothetical protein
MAAFRIKTVVLACVAGACVVGAASAASAQALRPLQAAVTPMAQTGERFARCPKSPEQYGEVMKQLVAATARARALADEDPLLEPDAAFYEAELSATRKCAPSIAALTR